MKFQTYTAKETAEPTKMYETIKCSTNMGLPEMEWNDYINTGSIYMDTTVHLYANLPYIVNKLDNVTNPVVFRDVSNLQLPSFMDPPTEITPYIIGTDVKQAIMVEEFMRAINLHDVGHYIKENQDTKDMPSFMETQSQASSLTLVSSYTRLGDDKVNCQ